MGETVKDYIVVTDKGNRHHYIPVSEILSIGSSKSKYFSVVEIRVTLFNGLQFHTRDVWVVSFLFKNYGRIFIMLGASIRSIRSIRSYDL